MNVNTTKHNPAAEAERKLEKAGRLYFMASKFEEFENKKILDYAQEGLVQDVIKPVLEQHGMGLISATELVRHLAEVHYKVQVYAEKADQEEQEAVRMHAASIDPAPFGS